MQTKKVILNTFYQLLGKAATGILALITTILLARSLGAFYYGEFIKISTYTTLFYILVDFGLNTIFLKENQNKTNANFKKILTLRILLSIILYFISIVGMYLLSFISRGFSFQLAQTMWACALSIITYSLFLTNTMVFQSQRRYDLSALAQTLGAMAGLIFLIMFYQQLSQQNYTSLFWAVAGFICNSLIVALVSVFCIRPPAILGIEIDTTYFKQLMIKSLPLGLTLIFNIIYFHLDTLILSISRGSGEVGAYGLAYKFFEISLVLPTFFMNSLYPDLINEKEGFNKWGRVLGWLFSTSMIVSLVMWWGAGFLPLIKQEYVNSISYLKLLSFSIPIFYLTSPIMWWYVIKNQQKYLIWIYGISLLVNLGLNIIYIPQFGATAAAITTGISEMIVLLLGIISLRKNLC